MYLLGYDLGSSSVKASILDAQTGRCIASAQYPESEMEIIALKTGWAEQNPSTWWQNVILVTRAILLKCQLQPEMISSIGISYQMHGLVIVNKSLEVLRPSIIWCDSRAVDTGEKAFNEIGKEKCLSSMLNSPGNFTASKLKWVKDNEPAVYSKVYKMMLPGDYLAMMLTGEINTTSSGLSEGILWDFHTNAVSETLLKHYEFDPSLIPEIVPCFGEQGKLTKQSAALLGIKEGTPVNYRAGDQPNNALSLNVLNPGEIAATAGTSGVIYGVSDVVRYDPNGRVNSFAHVNHISSDPRLGVLLCINGTGILNSWLKRNVFAQADYETINQLACNVSIGSDGLVILPFGNGAERMLGNRDLGCRISNLNFNVHNQSHFARAAQEGIVFALAYGMEIMQGLGINPSVIRAGHANMFLSPVFRQSLSDLTGATIELYNTDGSQGAARGAGIGSGVYTSFSEAFGSLEKIREVIPNLNAQAEMKAAYGKWTNELMKYIN